MSFWRTKFDTHALKFVFPINDGTRIPIDGLIPFIHMQINIHAHLMTLSFDSIFTSTTPSDSRHLTLNGTIFPSSRCLSLFGLNYMSYTTSMYPYLLVSNFLFFIFYFWC
ncbi:hypothetical protein NE237_006349 [Protea cynaroides]|uniref:Uncharacterized protein n=1 Tax=Protea cynaroides TaxID=273540 RepID=A0A9Q0KMF7_9MAGN|nr:hypothetical protein NE237_006349 [Protea cynaroides]